MPEAQSIVALAQRARASGEHLCLATVVHVEGSAYRKPGARMLLASGGERAGTISGGCLESEISRKAWWLSAEGPRIERYSSFADEDGDILYGLGCGGTVSLLLEQGAPAEAALAAMEQTWTRRQPAIVITALHNGEAGTIAVLMPQAACSDATESPLTPLQVTYLRVGIAAASFQERLAPAARNAFAQQRSLYLRCLLPSSRSQMQAEESQALPEYFIEYLAPPPALTIFGAGDDAQPIAALAHALGWRVSVADGRAHLARQGRFPQAADVRVLNYADPGLRAACGLPLTAQVALRQPGLAPTGSPQDENLLCDQLAVILTHSYEQDRALLAALLTRELHYLGILGPRHRTGRLLAEVCPALGLSVEQGFARLHSPIGLDLGAGDPAAVALSIVAEIQAVLHSRHVAITRAEAHARGPMGEADKVAVALAPEQQLV